MRILIVCLLLCLSCTDSSEWIVESWKPIIQDFKNKNIKYVPMYFGLNFRLDSKYANCCDREKFIERISEFSQRLFVEDYVFNSENCMVSGEFLVDSMEIIVRNIEKPYLNMR